MDNKEFARKLERRTRDFALTIIRLSLLMTNTAESRVLKNQLTKSGTSIGANYREANHSRSKADFKNKIRICESEASETQYWIEIIKELNWLPDKKIIPIYKECSELLAIFTSIGKELNQKQLNHFKYF